MKRIYAACPWLVVGTMWVIIVLLLFALSLHAQVPDTVEWLALHSKVMPPLLPTAARAVPPELPPPGKNVVLAFDAPTATTGITGYRIYYRDEAGLTNNADVGMGTTNTLYLTQGASYKFWAVSYNALAESVPSNEVSYTVPVTVPPARTAVIVLWTGPGAQGPWPTPLTTNRVAIDGFNRSFRQTITIE